MHYLLPFVNVILSSQITNPTGCSEWGKFYPKRVTQIGGVELSTQISHIIFLIQKSYPKNISSKVLLHLFNITLYTKTVIQLILSYFIDENIISQNCFTVTWTAGQIDHISALTITLVHGLYIAMNVVRACTLG